MPADPVNDGNHFHAVGHPLEGPASLGHGLQRDIIRSRDSRRQNIFQIEAARDKDFTLFHNSLGGLAGGSQPEFARLPPAGQGGLGTELVEAADLASCLLGKRRDQGVQGIEDEDILLGLITIDVLFGLLVFLIILVEIQVVGDDIGDEGPVDPLLHVHELEAG